MRQMSHESSFEPVSGFPPKVRIRVRFRVGIWIGVGFSVRVGIRIGVYSHVKHFDL